MAQSRTDLYPWAKFLWLTLTWNKWVALWKEHRTIWECVCDCWNKVRIRQNLIWRTKSCWCAIANNNKSRATHWMHKSRLYRTRINMRVRCSNPKDIAYSRYWWRGIRVCDEWNNSFEKFYEDMWASYNEHVKKFWEKETTIDRINVNWNYCKENCRRATLEEQRLNQRWTHHWRRYNEYWFTLSDLSAKYNLWIWAISRRLHKWFWWNMDKLLEHLNWL